MRVALHTGQLGRRVPGGIGRYVAALVEHLPAAGVEVEPFRGGRLVDEARQRTRHPVVRTPGDVVHAPSMAVAPAGDRPLVVTIHDLAFRELPDAFTARGLRFHERGLVLARDEATAVVVPSDFVRHQVVDAGLPADRVTTIHHGVTVPSAAELRRVRVGPPYVLAVGTVEPRKRLPDIAAAVATARRTRPDLELVVAGPPGWGEVELPDEPWLRRTGPVEEQLLDSLYRGATALVQASAHEGFGFPLIEAMGRGCPVVAVDAASAPEVVAGAALLVAPGDVDALAEALGRISTDPALAADLAARGRARAAHFTWERAAGAHAEVYRRALATAPPG